MFAWLERVFFSTVEAEPTRVERLQACDDPAWKPSQVSYSTARDYAYQAAKDYQEEKRRRAELVKQLDAKLSASAVTLPKIRRVR